MKNTMIINGRHAGSNVSASLAGGLNLNTMLLLLNMLNLSMEKERVQHLSLFWKLLCYPKISIANIMLGYIGVKLITCDSQATARCHCFPPNFWGKESVLHKTKMSLMRQPLKNTDITGGNTVIYQSTNVAILASTKIYMLQNGYIIL